MKTEKIPEPYHHGDLRAAVLGSAEAILNRGGLAALSLRACARETGVSHAAPAHHFPTLVSLLSALAAIGFERLADALQDAISRPGFTQIELGKVYVEFARDNREMFSLMNDPSRLDSKNPELVAARRKAYEALSGVSSISLENPSLEQVGLLTGKWAVCHGLAMLLLMGRLNGLLGMAPEGTTEMDLVDAALGAMSRR